LPGKINFFSEKSKLFRKFAWKNRNFFGPDPRPPAGSTSPEISNQIDAADPEVSGLIVWLTC